MQTILMYVDRLPTVRCLRRQFLALSMAWASRIHTFCLSGKHSLETSSMAHRLLLTLASLEEKVS